MSYPHGMRLHRPWQVELWARPTDARPDGDDTGSPIAARLTVPGDWGSLVSPSFRGTVRWRRRFGRPARLDPHERCWLTLGGVDPGAIVYLNDEPLGSVAGYALGEAWDITSRLKPRNELRCDVAWPGGVLDAPPLRPGRAGLPGGVLGEVQLEIDGGGRLADLGLAVVAVDADAVELRLSGQVNAHSMSALLEVVVNAAGRELGHGQVLVGQRLDWTCPLGEWPTWAQGGHGNRTGTRLFEIKLLAGGTSVWQRTIAAGPARSVVELAASTGAPPLPSPPLA